MGAFYILNFNTCERNVCIDNKELKTWCGEDAGGPQGFLPHDFLHIDTNCPARAVQNSVFFLRAVTSGEDSTAKCG